MHWKVNNSRNTDALILGAGAIGLSCAWRLLKAGRRVTVLDRGAVGSGASHGNCGTITPSHAAPLARPGVIAKALRWMWRRDAPFYIRPRFDPALMAWLWRFARRCNWDDFRAATRHKAALLTASRELIAGLIAAERLDCGFEASGSLFVYRSLHAFESEHWMADAARAVGIPVEIKDAKALQAMEPALNDAVVAAYYFPTDAMLRPDRYVAELARIVRAAGGEILEHTPVAGLSVEGGRVTGVRAAHETFAARDVVLALGAWSPLLAKSAGLDLPVQPGKGYSITYTRPARAPRIPMVLEEPRVCVTAWGDGLRLGSTMEFSGYDATLNRVRLDALVRAARDYLREPTGPQLIEEWYGWRPMTYDDLPIIGRSPKHQNLWLATGHGMVGMSLSAVTGKLIAELVTGAPPCVDPAPYRPQRFGR